MKRFVFLLVALLFLCGCGKTAKPIDKAVTFRTKLLQSSGCEFVATITADYFDKLQIFKMRCRCDHAGKLAFEVLEPASIAGITGQIDGQTGNLTFDDQALLFSLMAENRISPVSAPWIMLEGLQSGYISSCAETENGLKLYIDDTLNDEKIQLILWVDARDALLSAELFYHERRILTVAVEAFTFL